MIKVEGYALWRGGVKIGYVEDHHVLDHEGKKVGFCSNDTVYDMGSRKLARIEGDYIYFMDSSSKLRIEDNDKDIIGGSLTNAERAAVRIFLGE